MAAGKYKTDQSYDDDIDFIKESDAVQGDPAATDPDTVALTGPINVVIQKIVSSLAYLNNAVDNFSVSRMTDSVFGTGKIATQEEAEAGTAHGTGGPVLTPLRGLDLIRGSAAQATEDQRGTVEFATETEAQDESNNTKALTAASLYTSEVVSVTGSFENLRRTDTLNSGTPRISNFAVAGNVSAKKFGPIVIGSSSSGNITITFTYYTGGQHTSFSATFDLVDTNFDHNDYSWSISGGDRSVSSTATGFSISRSGAHGYGYYTHPITLTGTPN